jgi:choice-of-anchor B domain-containing protein
MIRTVLITLLLCITINSYSQQSLNMTLRSELIPANITPGNPGQFNDIWGYSAPDGREYAIFGSQNGTHFVDVTNPDSIVEIQYELGSAGATTWRDFKTYDHYAYGVADGGNHSLQIFDLQYLPDSVVKVYDDNEFTDRAHNIHVNKNRLYLIDNTVGGVRTALSVLCLENPELPTLIGGLPNTTVGQWNSGHDIFVSNDTVYLSVYFNGAGNTGLHAFDFTDPANPVLLGSIQNYPGAGINHASWMSSDGDYAIMVDENLASPVKMVDIRDLSNMQTVSTFAPNPGAIAHNPFIKNCLAFISYYHEGVQVYDISDPATGYFDTDTTIGNGNYNPNYEGCWGVFPYLPSGNIIASDRKNGLFVLTYNGPQPNCSGDFDKVVEMDTSRICVDTTTSPLNLTESISSGLEVYPNPGSGLFTIQISQMDIVDINVFDLRGVEINVEITRIKDGKFQIDLINEKAGIYFLNIKHEGGANRLKIFKE